MTQLIIILVVVAAVVHRLYQFSNRVRSGRSGRVRTRRPRRPRSAARSGMERTARQPSQGGDRRLVRKPQTRLQDDTDEGVSLEHPGQGERLKALEAMEDREHQYDYATRRRVRTWKLRFDGNDVLTGIVMKEILAPPKGRVNMARQRRYLQEQAARAADE